MTNATPLDNLPTRCVLAMKLIFNSGASAPPAADDLTPAASPVGTQAGALDVASTTHLVIPNDADPIELAQRIQAADCIDLQFPKFTDGRAYSQAMLIRKRLGYKGELRATGDVLVDQLQLMQRAGFSAAVLRSDQDPSAAERMLALFSEFYQGDALQAAPRFAREAS